MPSAPHTTESTPYTQEREKFSDLTVPRRAAYAKDSRYIAQSNVTGMLRTLFARPNRRPCAEEWFLRRYPLRRKRAAGSAALDLNISNWFSNVNYFFGAAFFLPKLVSTDAPILANICLAASALAPVGCSSRYFWNASAVPGGATILSPCSVAWPIMFTPFQ